MLTILTTENLYFGHGHGQNGYFFGLISCQNLRLTISTMKNLDFGHGHGRNFDHMTIVISKFWPWSWSKFFDHMTMTPARRPYGQKIMVALPPPA